ncbi:dapper homolog 1 isoform X2 [Anabas testudineus]|uniref:dapper homolog 1 isoform X2 n=1 Tax=Anabas testudineus TaxID=64144 RepID=UPI000E4624F6|nr:dapper homolog 1 isoform X2 [Anabas testudineus]
MLPTAASRRDRAADPDAAERLRSVRERLEATVSGLGELEFLRQRQEVLVRAALELREEVELSSEEKLLEENILLLRKQLNCLRRRDAGLIGQLQELDRQICDLRLDPETEIDSRPSSGFYELSDDPSFSVSLSNSSNSVFSECFCSAPDADGRLLSTDELASCLECDGLVGGLCDDSSFSGTVRRSLSAPHPSTLDPVSSVACDQLKYHCDLVARNGSDVYRYPSPLHAVAVQSPVLLQMLGHGGHSGDERFLKSTEAGVEAETSSISACLLGPLVPQSSSWPAPSSSSSLIPSHKQLDGYIYSLLQRRALPVRTNKPRTSISTEPSKSILRQASLCVRQASGSGLGAMRGSELKSSRMTGGALAEDPATSSLQRQWSVESKCEEQETQNVFSSGSVDMQTGKLNNTGIQTSTNSLLKNKNKGQLPLSAVPTATPPKDFRELGSPKVNSTPKDTKQPCYPPDQEVLIKSPPTVKTQLSTLKNSPKPLQTSHTGKGERSAPELASLGSSSQSQEEGGGGGGRSSQQQNIKHRKSGSKTVKLKTSQASEFSEPVSERRRDKSHHRSGTRKTRLLEDEGSTHIKVSRRLAGGATGVGSSRIKRLPASIPEGRVLDKQNTSTLSSVRSAASRHHHGNHHHHHHRGRDQVVVVAKPKHKRNDYRCLRAIMEVSYDEAFGRAHRCQRKEQLSHSAAKVCHPSGGQMTSPYSYTGGSDSEYSAECASLFHSTIVDTSEDERSNYTTNCFGDSESSNEEYMEESASDTEESGGGGTHGISRGWSQLGTPGARAVGQKITPSQAKAFVKIKASHNLKKKILRFRSGSLKLMTTV